MRITFQNRDEEVAGGRSATSVQPQHATAGLIPERSASERPRPYPRVCAAGTYGALQEGLLFAALPARSQYTRSFGWQLQLMLRDSR
jgi:hypothetical protein